MMMDAYRILQSYDRNGVLGELTGKSPGEVDRLLRHEHRGLREALQKARRRAFEEKRELEIDCARLSGVNGGERCLVAPDETTRRQLDRFPEVEAQLLEPEEPAPGMRHCASLQQARPLLARCAYNGLWSPSGTNWQPIRSVELTASEVERLLPRSGETACGLLVLARRRYQSIVGDIAGLCGVDPHCHAEDIDLGIWLLAAEQTARAHGWRFEPRLFPAERQSDCLNHLQRIARERIARLPDGSEREREAAKRLLAGLEAGEYRPHCLLVPLQGRPLELDAACSGGLRPSPFDRLVEARSTQRVASPAGEMQIDALGELFEIARAFIRGPVAGSLVDTIRFPLFSWNDPLVEQVGVAMHQAVQGPGGFMQRANPENLRAYLGSRRLLPDDGCAEPTVAESLQRWTALGSEQLEKAGEEVVLPARAMPPYLLSKLLEGTLFQQEGELVVDRRKRPITIPLFLNLVRMMLGSFVRFSLGFRNTHPLLGILLAPASAEAGSGSDTLHENVFHAMGRVVGHMTLLSRARGTVSIIKSGPTEIAGDSIRRALSEQAVDEEVRRATGAGELHPILTFQLGLPLGPDESVCSGQPEEHDGLQERLLDRRASRAPLLDHYLPAAAKG